MGEEHGLEVAPEAPRLCANQCGFFGSPATLGLCSKCFQEKEKTLSSDVSSVRSSSSFVLPSLQALEAQSSSSVASASWMKTGRCACCRKKVGLMGFRCRCGESFCSSHRYPELHDCTFDFKTSAREAIARANPVVKADKLDRL